MTRARDRCATPHRCVSIGAAVGLLAGKLTGSSLVYSSLSSAFFGAYLSTLSNPLGKTIRLVGVVAVALVSNSIAFVGEQHRSFSFVYQTGKLFERLDSSLQVLDANLGSPSKRWDAVAGFLGSEILRTANETNQVVSDVVVGPVGAWLSNATSVVVDWSGGAVTGIDSTLKVSDGVRVAGRFLGGLAESTGSAISELQSEWFEKEEAKRLEGLADSAAAALDAAARQYGVATEDLMGRLIPPAKDGGDGGTFKA